MASGRHLHKIFNGRIFKRLGNLRLVSHNVEGCCILILHHVVKFSLKNRIVSVTFSPPIFNKELFNTSLLIETLNGSLLSIGKIDTIKVFARFGFSLIFDNNSIAWLSHFLNIKVKNVKIFILRFLLLWCQLFFFFNHFSNLLGFSYSFHI